jgi:ribose-phosphate pyrophosphokinase
MAKIIAGNSVKHLAKSLSQHLGLDYLEAQIERFADEELRVQLGTSVYKEDVVIVQSTSKPANDHLMELLLLVDAAERAGARQIVALMPYFGYSRQDKPSYEWGPISARLIATLLESAKVNQLITLDFHSKQLEGFFQIGVQNLNPIPLFANTVETSKDLIVVSPDVGGLIRAQKLAGMLDCDIAVLNKIRHTYNTCEIKQVIGSVKDKHCIIIDDIIDTAGTLCKSATLLKQEGALSIQAMVTHPVLSGDAMSKLEKAPIEKIITTQSIYQPNLSSRFQFIDIVPLLGKAVKRILN